MNVFLGITVFSKVITLPLYAQCAPVFLNPNQKAHGLFHFDNAVLYKTARNQLKSHLILGFQNSNPKKRFSILKLECLWHFIALFTTVNFGSLITDVFFN